MKIFRTLAPFLIIGLILRFLLAAFTFHPDILEIDYTSAIILRGYSLDPYSFYHLLAPNDPRKIIFSSQLPDDLPLQYWIHIPVDFVLRSLVDIQTENQFLSDITPLFGHPQLYLLLLIVKLPLILFDIGIGLTLTLIVPNGLRKKIFLYWMLNPFTLWATEAIGQVDIMPTFFMVLAFYLVYKNKLNLSVVSLGIGGALKSFPFLIAPFFIMTAENWVERIKLVVLLFIPAIMSVIPYLGSREFRTNALFAPQLDKTLYAKIYLSGGEEVFINGVILIVLYLLYLNKKRTFQDVLSYSIIAFLSILAFTHFHIQWIVWVAPLILVRFIEKINESHKISLILLSLSVLVMLFMFESSLQIKLFSPLIPNLNLAKGIAETLRLDQIELIRSFAATIFLGSTIFLSRSLLFQAE